MNSGKFSSRTLTGKYLERIQAIDMAGPNVNAVIEINPDALTIAAALDRERAGGKVRGPLHGIPVLIKDNIDTADRMTDHGRVAGAGRIGAPRRLVRRRSGCAQRARSFWARPISANGPTSGPRIPPADGAGAGARPGILMRSIAIRAVPAPGRARRRRPIFARSRSEPKQTARLCAHHP